MGALGNASERYDELRRGGGSVGRKTWKPEFSLLNSHLLIKDSFVMNDHTHEKRYFVNDFPCTQGQKKFPTACQRIIWLAGKARTKEKTPFDKVGTWRVCT